MSENRFPAMGTMQAAVAVCHSVSAAGNVCSAHVCKSSTECVGGAGEFDWKKLSNLENPGQTISNRSSVIPPQISRNSNWWTQIFMMSWRSLCARLCVIAECSLPHRLLDLGLGHIQEQNNQRLWQPTTAAAPPPPHMRLTEWWWQNNENSNLMLKGLGWANYHAWIQI